mmetsp:Transcript_36353/g.116756  ORF Transcript_36353/g.116756 Transcript_36353/m.116756 type:complete len:227 (-) Transcript_36353:1064-1744(-)
MATPSDSQTPPLESGAIGHATRAEKGIDRAYHQDIALAVTTAIDCSAPCVSKGAGSRPAGTCCLVLNVHLLFLSFFFVVSSAPASRFRFFLSPSASAPAAASLAAFLAFLAALASSSPAAFAFFSLGAESVESAATLYPLALSVSAAITTVGCGLGFASLGAPSVRSLPSSTRSLSSTLSLASSPMVAVLVSPSASTRIDKAHFAASTREILPLCLGCACPTSEAW